MRTRHFNGPETPSLPKLDDLKLIHGIGPGIERRLHAADIVSFAQLAKLTSQEVLARIGHHAGFTVRRIEEEKWIEQARDLALPSRERQASPQPGESSANTIEKTNRQRANFTVELVIGQDGEVRATRAAYVQSGGQNTWAGWDAERLVDFFVQNAQLRLPPEVLPTSATGVDSVEIGPQPSNSGSVRLCELALISNGVVRRVVRNEQPFDVRVNLDLSQVSAPGPLAYIANLQARKFGTTLSQPVREQRGIIEPADSLDMLIEHVELPEGLYYLDIAVTLTPAAVVEPSVAISAELEGLLIQVY